jgi:hypothetical protein
MCPVKVPHVSDDCNCDHSELTMEWGVIIDSGYPAKIQTKIQIFPSKTDSHSPHLFGPAKDGEGEQR